MDYTQSDSFDTHAGTGNRHHNMGKAVPTQISDKDLNQAIWSLMELLKAVGMTGAQFDVATPATYTKVRDAIQVLMQRQTPNIGVAGGTANAISATFLPVVESLTPGMRLFVRSSAASTSTTPTFTPNSGTIAAWPIVKGANQALAVGDIPAAGYWMELSADPVTNKWVLMNPATGITAVSGFQAADPMLTALAGLTTVADRLLYFTGADSPAQATLTSFMRTLLDDADAATARATLGSVASSAFANSLATNGYQQLPGGLILQWGTTASIPVDQTFTVTFNVAFPTACVHCLATGAFNGINGGGVLQAAYYFSTLSTTTASGHNDGTAGVVRWFALGY